EAPDDAKQIASPTGRFRGISWLRNALMLTQSQASSFPEFWFIDPGGHPTRLVGNNLISQNARICGDRFIVFTSNRSGTAKVWRVDTDGKNLKQLTEGPFADRSPACSPDGNWLVYDSLHSDKATLWKIAIDGGPAHQLTTDVSQDPEVSPD